MSTFARVVAVLVAAALVLGGGGLVALSLLRGDDGSNSGTDHPTAPASTTPAAGSQDPPDPALEPFYTQRLDWQPCRDDFSCATLTVPLDYAEPTGQTIDRPFKPTVTDVGRRHPVTAGLPGDNPEGDPSWGRWFHQVEVTPTNGSVVMNGADNRPLLILDRVGKGRVAQLASDQIWLWSRGFEGGGPQAELLRRLAHWLMKEPELEENDLRARVDGNKITVERRSLEPDPRSITLTTPSDQTRTLEMTEDKTGRAATTVVAAEPGIYRVTDGDRTALAVVGAVNPPELADVRSTGDKLAPVAKETGGGIQWISDTEGGVRPGIDVRRTRPDRSQTGDGWIGLRANGDFVVTGVSEVPLLPVAAVLALALGALLLAWRREGR